MDRETRTIEMPIGKEKVSIYTYLTGGEKRKFALQQTDNETQEFAMKNLIQSIGEEKDANKFVALIDAMHGQDFDFLFLELAKSIDASAYKKKD